MNSRVRQLVPAVLAILALGVVGAGLAWACTKVGYIKVTPEQGRPGSATLVEGTKYFEANEGEISFHWQRANGPVLDRANGSGKAEGLSGPNPSARVRIPNNAAEETYSIVAVAKPNDVGKAAYGPGPFVASAPFTVTGAEARGGNREQSANGGDAGGGSRANATKGLNTGTERGDQSGRGTGSGGSGGGGGGARADGRPPSPPSGNLTFGADRGRSGALGSGDVRSFGDDQVFGGSVAGATQGSAGAAAAAADAVGAPGGAAEAPSPSERSASGDLWSGFGSGEGPSAPTLDGPPAPGDQPASQLAIGMGILGVGLVVLFAGFAVAVLRRRRVAA